MDFIDVGLGGWRFWTFNVADMAIAFGAIVLVMAMYRTLDESARFSTS